jgi:hypothetical protein
MSVCIPSARYGVFPLLRIYLPEKRAITFRAVLVRLKRAVPGNEDRVRRNIPAFPARRKITVFRTHAARPTPNEVTLRPPVALDLGDPLG